MLSKHTSVVLGTKMQCLYLTFKYFIDIFDTIVYNFKGYVLKKKKSPQLIKPCETFIKIYFIVKYLIRKKFKVLCMFTVPGLLFLYNPDICILAKSIQMSKKTKT